MTSRFTGMFVALQGRSSLQGAKVTGLLVTFHPLRELDPAQLNLSGTPSANPGSKHAQGR